MNVEIGKANYDDNTAADDIYQSTIQWWTLEGKMIVFRWNTKKLFSGRRRRSSQKAAAAPPEFLSYIRAAASKHLISGSLTTSRPGNAESRSARHYQTSRLEGATYSAKVNRYYGSFSSAVE